MIACAMYILGLREKYNVSALRDKSKVFICEDCVRRDAAKISRKKYKPVYDCRGFATERSD